MLYPATHGFGEECLQFFRNFFSAALKDGEHCRLGVMTGILRVAKEGVLFGLNNPEVWSVFDDEYSDCSLKQALLLLNQRHLLNHSLVRLFQ